MKRTIDTTNIYNIYQEGIFDRVGARMAGVANSSVFGGSGYNAGKASSFKEKLYARIIKDIDKFLDEVQTMNGLKSLAEFEQKYPEMAQKVRCMADEVGHTTGLTVSCKKQQPTPPPNPSPTPNPTPAPTPNPTPAPSPGKIYGYACNKKTGKCMKIEAVKKEGNNLRSAKGTFLFRTLDACKKKCKKSGGGDNRLSSSRLSNSGYQNQTVGRDNYGNMGQHSGSGDMYQGKNVTVNNFYQVVNTEIKKGKSEKAALAAGLRKVNIKVTPQTIEKAKVKYHNIRDKKGRFAPKPTA